MHTLSPLWREHRLGHGPVMAIGEQLEAGLTREQLQRLLPAGAARNAIDCALWDLQARREGKTLAQLLGVALPNRVITAQTVVIGTPDQMAASAAALWQAGAQLLKVKLDDRLISERLIAIRRGAAEATLIVDANESGTARAGGALSAAGGPRCGDA
ncbi:hypothetical protein [Klebsiella pneumoniae]|uniref:hypothetical protein n=1 Tax=Klebsiella pneumoniae TaxID=573 RepID=UPI002234B3EE|nr:hypothetical protein [Klebsiella pneumoniae]